jgi:HD-GYP domain-containing protein (c-di-GMP phosphodiesterase class II)
MGHTAAVHELLDNAGAQFDPDVVKALVGQLYARRQSGAAAPAAG